MVTRKQVAQYAGVSEGTVSNVLKGKVAVAKEKRERVLAAIEALRYVPDQTARNLVTRRSNHIGVAIYELTNPYHMEITKRIEERASRNGFIVSFPFPEISALPQAPVYLSFPRQCAMIEKEIGTVPLTRQDGTASWNTIKRFCHVTRNQRTRFVSAG